MPTISTRSTIRPRLATHHTWSGLHIATMASSVSRIVLIITICSFLALNQIISTTKVLSVILNAEVGGNSYYGLNSSQPLYVQSMPCVKSSELPPNWCFDNNKDPHYFPFGASSGVVDASSSEYINSYTNETVEIKDFTHDGVQKCLANKTIIFIGDSRVRYQWMNLASFLKTKRFMKCEDDYNAQEPDEECLLIMHTKVGAWSDWYNISTRMLTDDDVNVNNHTQLGSIYDENQTALCDCSRPDKRGIQWQSHNIENRYVQRNTQHGQINLVYLLNFVNLVQFGEDFPPYSSFDFSPKCCKPGGKCGRLINAADVPCKNAFSGNTNTSLWEAVPQFFSNYHNLHLFVNLGWEKHNDLQKQSDLSCSLQEFGRMYQAVKPYLISHPPTRHNVKDPSVLFDASKVKCNKDLLFDRTTINKNVPLEWYLDDVHLNSILNREYNQQLMRILCPELL